MRLGKKALAPSIITIMIFMIFFGISSLASIAGWNQFNSVIQNADNETINPLVKDKIDDLGSRILWADKLFVTFFIVLLISYLISATTTPAEQPIWFFLFLGFLIFVSVIAMYLSNSWSYIIQNPNFIDAVGELPFTTYFMRYLPFITFFIGIGGALLFFLRRQNTDFNAGGGNIGNIDF